MLLGSVCLLSASLSTIKTVLISKAARQTVNLLGIERASPINVSTEASHYLSNALALYISLHTYILACFTGSVEAISQSHH